MRAAGVAAGAPGRGADGGAGMSVPSHLHQIWLGPTEVPVRWREPWLRKHPTWRHTLWRQADIEPLIDEPLRRVWDYYIGVRRWHGAADVARVAILTRHGGVYVDIDSEPVRSFDGADFMKADFFAGVSPEAPDFIANGVIGSAADHPILHRYHDRIAEAVDLEPAWQTVGGVLLTKVLAEFEGLPGLLILPTRTFYPEDKYGRKVPGLQRPYTRHYWATTHRLYKFESESPSKLLNRRRPRNERKTSLRERFRQVVPLPARRALRAVLRRVASVVHGGRRDGRSRTTALGPPPTGEGT
jgi:hypothetical protein